MGDNVIMGLLRGIFWAAATVATGGIALALISGHQSETYAGDDGGGDDDG